MKAFALSLLLSFSACTLSAADLVTLVCGPTFDASGFRHSQDIVLNAGDAASVVSKAFNPSVKAELAGGPTVTLMELGGIDFSPLQIAGPAVLRISMSNAYPVSQVGWATVSITRAGSPAAAPNGTVVIPEDATGQFQVLLESSTDLITWTAANPGTYGGSTQKRFFRTRIMKQ